MPFFVKLDGDVWTDRKRAWLDNRSETVIAENTTPEAGATNPENHEN